MSGMQHINRKQQSGFSLRRTPLTPLSYAIGVLCAGAAMQTPVYAQQQTDTADVAATQVIVTGTRVSNRSVLDTASAVDVVSAETLNNVGVTELSQSLANALPALNFPRPGLVDATDSVRPVTLRGLSPDQVLVLVNSKRRHSSALVNVNGSVGRGSASADLNTIPSSIINSVEVLRDGAAAQYGSDAIAGVINLRLRHDIGFSATTELGQFYNDDGATLYSAANYGVKIGDTGFVNVTVYFKDTGNTDRSGPDLRQQYFGTS